MPLIDIFIATLCLRRHEYQLADFMGFYILNEIFRSSQAPVTIYSTMHNRHVGSFLVAMLRMRLDLQFLGKVHTYKM